MLTQSLKQHKLFYNNSWNKSFVNFPHNCYLSLHLAKYIVNVKQGYCIPVRKMCLFCNVTRSTIIHNNSNSTVSIACIIISRASLFRYCLLSLQMYHNATTFKKDVMRRSLFTPHAVLNVMYERLTTIHLFCNPYVY